MIISSSQSGGDTSSSIVRFLNAALSKTEPLWIVATERKGTAILRTYSEAPDALFQAPAIWDKVISSESLRRMSGEDLNRGTILIVDEAMFSGRGASNAIKILVDEKGVEREKIKIAVYAVHENASEAQADFRWIGQLSTSMYRRVREQILGCFQQKGSLLLDTEHIEISVGIKCGRSEFFRALCRSGVGISHETTAGRLNLTINDPILVGEKELLLKLPKYATIRNAVKKIRVVERMEDKFAIIPIFYPSIPKETKPDDYSIDSCLSALLSESDQDANFHVVGIFAALQLFQTVFMSLSELMNQNKVDPVIPEESLRHMKALFPTINLKKLHAYVQNFRELGRTTKAKKLLSDKPVHFDATTASENASLLNDIHLSVIKELASAMDDYPRKPKGLTIGELKKKLFAEGQPFSRIELAKPLLGAALDRAIDQADIIPDIDCRVFDDGIERVVRTFRIDGEIVLSDARRITTLWTEIDSLGNSNRCHNRGE